MPTAPNRNRPRRTGRDILKRLLQRAFMVVAVGVPLVYLCDYVLLRFRIATNRQPYGTVTVHPFYAVPRKDHRIEFMFKDPEDRTCVYSLFPHMGDTPCWYLSRNTEQRINM